MLGRSGFDELFLYIFELVQVQKWPWNQRVAFQTIYCHTQEWPWAGSVQMQGGTLWKTPLLKIQWAIENSELS